ncbi:MAG: uroporphyrinogen decarboxylase family protein [Promethearchaeota archaeon]
MSILEFLPLYIDCGISFASDWFYYNAGLSMDEKTIRSTKLRLEYKKRATSFLEQRYPHIFMRDGKPKPESVIRPDLGWGVVTLASLLGARIRFDPKMDPTPIPTVDIKKINIIRDIKALDMAEALAPIFKEIDEYMDMGFSKREIGFPNMQGPLNIAFETFGDNQMLSLLGRKSREAEVRHILDVTTTAFVDAYKILRKELKRSRRESWTVAGCTYYYLSPRIWKKYVHPVLERYMDELESVVNLHHCSTATPDQIKTYASIKWHGLEFGFGTDISFVRRTIINDKVGPLNISCRISPYRMLNQPAEQIQKDVEWLIRVGKGGPQRIAVVGCPYGTPEENIHALWSTVQEFNKQKAEEEEEEDF